MKDKRISLRLNMERYSHRKAYEIYKSVAPQERSDFIRQAIILMDDREEMIKSISNLLETMLTGTVVNNETPAESIEEKVSESAANMLSFISSLNAAK